jgi:transposase
MPKKAVQEHCVEHILAMIEESRISGGKRIVLSLDPTHPIHNSIPGYRWQEKGAAQTQRLPANTGRRRITIVGAVNLVDHDIVPFVTESNADRELIKVFLGEVRKKYADAEKITIILDNAAYQKSYEVQEYAGSLSITLFYLPPYTPNLSLIERVWKFFKKKVLRDHYYATFKEFFEAICEFFVKWDDYADEMNRLLTSRFEIMEV